MVIEEKGKRLCEICFQQPQIDPTPEALPNEDHCEDCQREINSWSRALHRHTKENHQAPWDHNCQMCSLEAYNEERWNNWQEHLAQCEECQKSTHNFVTETLRCRDCGVEADRVAPDAVCEESCLREAHKNMC